MTAETPGGPVRTDKTADLGGLGQGPQSLYFSPVPGNADAPPGTPL